MIRPLNDIVVVKRSKEEQIETESGVLGVTRQKAEFLRGEVLAVGPGRWTKKHGRIPLTVQPGESVLFEKHHGTDVAVDGEEFLLIREENIAANV